MMKEIVNFLSEVGKLKDMKRSGWVLRNVKNPETIADHTFRLAIMAWILGDKKGLNIEKTMKIALAHDLCEVYAGDVTPYEKFIGGDKAELARALKKWPRFSKKEKIDTSRKKHRKELASLKKLTAKLPEKIKREIIRLWFEYENGSSAEARFIRQIDKLENLLQAFEYSGRDKKFPIDSWYVEIREKIDDPLLIEFIKLLGKKKK